MKKLINRPEDVVKEALAGMQALHPWRRLLLFTAAALVLAIAQANVWPVAPAAPAQSHNALASVGSGGSDSVATGPTA